jgi:16S rRNA processing protein RimM
VTGDAPDAGKAGEPPDERRTPASTYRATTVGGEAEPLSWDAMAVVGRVARPHGLRGDVVVNPQTDFVEERFRAGQSVFVERHGAVERVEIVRARVQSGRPVVAFAGAESIDAAESLTGLELRVPVEWLHPLPAHTYYVHDLVGCRVVAGGEIIGTVTDVEGDGGAMRLTVATTDGEVLVPLVDEICRSVDVARKAIEVATPAGLLELNRPTGLPRRKDRRAEEQARRRARRTKAGGAQP